MSSNEISTSFQALSTITTQISQQCQPKSRLLINHKTNDGNFGKNVSSEINLHQTKEIQETPSRHQNLILPSSSDGENSIIEMENLYQRNHENGITIVTISDA